MRTRIYAVIAILMFGVAAIGLPQAAHAITYTDMATFSSNHCLDDPDNGGNGTDMQLWLCNSNPQQQLALVPSGYHGGSCDVDFCYEIQLQNGKCLDITNGDSANGTPIQVYTCLHNANQAWIPYGQNGSGTQFVSGGIFQPSGATVALDNYNNYQSNGNKIQVWTYLFDASQTWCSLDPHAWC